MVGAGPGAYKTYSTIGPQVDSMVKTAATVCECAQRRVTGACCALAGDARDTRKARARAQCLARGPSASVK